MTCQEQSLQISNYHSFHKLKHILLTYDVTECNKGRMCYHDKHNHHFTVCKQGKLYTIYGAPQIL